MKYYKNFKNFSIKNILKAAKIVLLLLFISLLFSCKKPADAYEKYITNVDNTQYIDKNIIKEKNGNDYIVDINGKEQIILDNIFDASVGEVAYFGEYGGAKIPFVVVRRKNDFMEIMSIPKFNIKREGDYFFSTNKWNVAESFNLLNTIFLKTCFNKKEIENIVPFEYQANKLQIKPDKELLEKFSIVYDQNYKDEYWFPVIYSKVLLHEKYVNGIYNESYRNDYLDEKDKNADKVESPIHDMWNCNVENKAKGITYSYDYKDFVYQTGIDVYEYNTRVELRLKNIKTDRYIKNANGFIQIATGSDLEKEEYGYYYLRDGNIVKNEIVENNGTKYYLSDTGKAIELKDFTIQNFNGTKVLISDNVIVRDKIINREEITIDNNDSFNYEKYYIDVNGIVHKLVSDIKDADVADTVLFGHNSKDSNKSLLWRVVENLDGVYTLILEDKISLDIVDENIEKRIKETYDGKVSIHDSAKTWDKSDRRKYLNEVFYNESFSDEEKEIIVSNPLRAEAFINEKYFSGKGRDVYDKVFVYNQNTTPYMKKYSESFEMLKNKKPSIYNDKDIYLNFNLADSDKKSVRPWIVVNITGESVPMDENNRDYVVAKINDEEDYKIPKVKNDVLPIQINFGKYLQFGSEQTNIYWELIAIDDSIAYFVARQVLDFEIIKESNDELIKWSNSKLRDWLNNTFINKIFSSSEKEKLEKIKKKYQYLDSNGNIKEEECEDLITLLNYDEVPIYLSTGVKLSNKSFKKIDAIDRKGTAAATSLFDNKSHKFYSACYKADDVGNSEDGKVEIKVNNTDYVGILPVIALKIDKLADISISKKVKKNLEENEGFIEEIIANSQFLFKEGLYGEVIKMGKYQNKELEWVILDRKRDYALVMAKESLFTDSILGRYGTSSWETSNIRKLLNTEIYNECFSDDEKMRIKPVKIFTAYTESEIRSDKNDPYNLVSLIDDETIDYLFLPEETDINVIVKSPLKTPYKEGEIIWLRNGDINGFYASNFNEIVDLNLSRKKKKYNVRPLMWIKYKE